MSSLGPLLELRGFGVGFGERIVLADVTLDLPRRGLTTIVGPAAAGKSTLLRTIAGLNDPHPALSTWGTSSFGGIPLQAAQPAVAGELRRGVGFVMQHARFFLDDVRENLVSGLPNRAEYEPATQTKMISALLEARGLHSLVARLDEDVTSLSTPLQRRLAIVRALAGDPPLLLADEPTADLDESDAIDVLALLRMEAKLRSVVLVTHNQRFARALGGNVVLLAAGRVQEIAPAETFWSAPSTPMGRSFVATGGCREPSPDARPEDLDSSPPPPPLPGIAQARNRFLGPRGFFWLSPGRLGGLPRPGIVDAVESDLDGLVRLGITTLVTLEESPTVDPALLDFRDIASIHFPVVDMDVPDLDAAAALATDLDARLERGEVIAVHCRAGLGRTGTLLAAQLVFDGENARTAIERVRRLNPKCIQSSVQVDFLASFEDYLRGRDATAIAPAPMNKRLERGESNDVA